MADLFKTLSRLGISYRTGIIVCRSRNFSVEFAGLKPVDIGLSYSELPKKYVELKQNGCKNDFFLKNLKIFLALLITF